MNNYLITIVGPTAIGKTALSIAVAKHFDAEILSCDSRQFYKEMQIRTAVPSKEELSQAPHHFIHNKSIHDEYSVGQFEKEALAKLDQLFKNNKIVVMVGGSGLYVDAVLKGLDYFPKIDAVIREKLNIQLEKEGLENLQTQLASLDPETYKKIDVKNPRRVIRALEVCLGAEKPFSFYKNQPKAQRNFISIKIGLDAKREIIYKRIEQRVDIMIKDGLVDEAKALYPNKKLNAVQTVGYRELFEFFNKKHTLDFAVSEIKKNTRRFAKRQNTWFKKDKHTHWFDYLISQKQIIKEIDLLINSK